MSLYIFADSEKVCDTFSSISADYDEVYVVEVELTDFNKSPRPDPAIGVALALNYACHYPEATVIVAAKRGYNELEDWARLISMRNVILCLEPFSTGKAEEFLKEAFHSASHR